MLCALFSQVCCLVIWLPAPADTVSNLDAALAHKWQAQNVAAEPIADDATFVRRAWLDLAGRVPPALKTKAFLDDKSPDKRARLIDELLASQEFAEHWGRAWAVKLTGKRPVMLETHSGQVLEEYLRDSLVANKSYRDIVREILTGDGARDQSGPANFLLRYDAKPDKLVGAVGKHFLGVTIQCAQCHDHKFAHWKTDDFWGMAAFFGRLKKLTNEEGEIFAVLEARKGELQQPDPSGKVGEDGQPAMKPVPPRLPGTDKPAAAGKRRQMLASWVTDDANPYFARNGANQIWAKLFGAPLVKSLDDVDTAVKSRHGDILELLAQDFAAGGYDMKRLIRVITLSRAYQLSAGGAKSAEVATSAEEIERGQRQLECFARFPVRSLSVDQLYFSIVQATGHKGEEDAQPEMTEKPDEDETPDRPVEFLGEHGLTVQRALVLLNSAYIQEAVQAGAKTAATLNGKRIGPAHIEWVFLATLSRRPTSDESKNMLALVKSDKGLRGLEDVLWVILNSAEFNSNY